MSTRSTTHFYHDDQDQPEAIIYRHSDGYPEGAGSDLLAFLRELQEHVTDSRLGDPSYLAAKYVVFLARMFNTGLEHDEVSGEYRHVVKNHPLNFIGVGVVREDPSDIEYRYEVRCKRTGMPQVECYEMDMHLDGVDGEVTKGKRVEIPEPQPDALREFALRTPNQQKNVVLA